MKSKMSVSNGLLTLCNQSVVVVLDPKQGGAVLEFSRAGKHFFRPACPDANGDPFQLSCFPMVPYVNRIHHGSFLFNGRNIFIARNWGSDPHPLHGQGWRREWTVQSAGETEAVLIFSGGGDEWPWRYESTQRFSVSPDGLDITLSVQNLARTPMPAAIGLHPYFPDAQAAILSANVPRVWRTENSLAVECIATPSEWQFAPARPAANAALDHSFSDWQGSAHIAWPDRGLQIETTGCAHMHVYTPVDRDFFCLEPQTAPAGALNRMSNEIAVLEPDARLTVTARFSIDAVSPASYFTI